MITVNVQNGDAADVFVTVTDNNTAPPQGVLSNTRLNYASAAVPVQITDNAAGRGNIAWTAVRCDDPTTIRSDATNTVTDGDAVYVSAV